jgi:hypothetical protein
MPKIFDCRKWSLDEQDIPLNSNALSLDVSRVKGKDQRLRSQPDWRSVLLVERLWIP